MSIKKSLHILLIIFTIVPVVIVSMFAHGMFSHKLIRTQKYNLQLISESNQSALEALIHNLKIEVSLLSTHEDLVKFSYENNFGLTHSSPNINDLLLKRKNLSNSYLIISLYNADKEIIASTTSQEIGVVRRNSETLQYMNNTYSEAFGINGIQPLQMNDQTYNTLEIGSPVFHPEESKQIIGYVISTICISYFENLLSSIKIDNTGRGVLLSNNGTIIYHEDPSLLGTKINSEKLADLPNNYRNNNNPKSGSFEYLHSGISKIYGYSIIPTLDWVILIEQNTSEIKNITSFMLLIIMFLCMFLLIIITYVASKFAKKFTEPIISLRDTMKIASDGNLTVQSNIKTKNELGELSKSFNKMLHIIKTNYEDLSSMHEELLSNEEQLRSNYDHIEYLAYHDILTNLPNKLSFLDYVNSILVSTPGSNKKHAVYFVDLDNFKTVNDTLGHEYGDVLLAKTAEVIKSILGDKDVIARAGGDEFLIFKEDIESKEAAIKFAARVIECFKHPLDIEGETVYVTISIGVSLYPENGLSPNSLIKYADIAMYRSKDTGKNKCTLFDLKMEEELHRNTMIVEVLRNAVKNNEIYVQYQPLVELETSHVIGFEALMRINSERLGSISPSEFIPIAEESGLIIELSAWLLKEACRFNKEIIDMGISPRPVSVNISSIQINRPGFISTLSQALEETQLPPQYLELEITESTLLSSLVDATKMLSKLQHLGVKVSLDDFGTGYSSLHCLTNLPINTLKIDKSFIDNLCYSEKDTCIADSIIQLAHSLNMKVVAEGVEHINQLNILKEKRCDIVQGFIFSKPLHPHGLIDIIQKA